MAHTTAPVYAPQYKSNASIGPCQLNELTIVNFNCHSNEYTLTFCLLARQGRIDASSRECQVLMLDKLVGVRGFEPPTSAFRTVRDPRLLGEQQ